MATRHVRFRGADPYRGPSMLSFRGGTLMVAAGQVADLTDEEIAAHPEAIFTDVVASSPAAGAGIATILDWAPSTNHVTDQVVRAPDGTLARRRSPGGISGATYDPLLWLPLSTVAPSRLAFATSNAAQTVTTSGRVQIAGGLVIAPVSDGRPIKLEGRVGLSLLKGTATVGAMAALTLVIVDITGAPVDLFQNIWQGAVQAAPVIGDLVVEFPDLQLAAGVSKTYRLEGTFTIPANSGGIIASGATSMPYLRATAQ